MLDEAQRRSTAEEGKRARYEARELSLDLNKMRSKLQEKGLTYIDAPDGLGE